MNYPKQTAKYGRKGLTFSADMNVSPIRELQEHGDTPPLQMFTGWSGISLSFADSEKGTGGSGNIEVKRLDDVKIRTRIAMQAVMEAEAKNYNSDEDTAVADPLGLQTRVQYCTAAMKAMKGATAINMAQAFPMEECQLAISTLRKNANGAWAESNRKQADALETAMYIVAAKKAGLSVFGESDEKIFAFCKEADAKKDPRLPLIKTLFSFVKAHPEVKEYIKGEVEMGANEKKRLIIYDPGLKTPNTSKLDGDGLTKAYKLSVICIPDDKYPFKVTLQTMRGKPLQGRNVGIDGKTAVDRKQFSIDLQTWEWVGLIEKAVYEKDLVEMINFKGAYDEARKYEEENRTHFKSA